MDYVVNIIFRPHSESSNKDMHSMEPKGSDNNRRVHEFMLFIQSPNKLNPFLTFNGFSFPHF
jgi:hypothetical protein